MLKVAGGCSRRVDMSGLILFALCGGQAGAVQAQSAPMLIGKKLASISGEPVGIAEQEPDGTVVSILRTEEENGEIAEARFRYSTADKNYNMIAHHVGPIPKGEAVLVKPFQG
jgi:hypothetical protein